MKTQDVVVPSGKAKTLIEMKWGRLSVAVAKQLAHNTKEMQCPQRTQGPTTVDKYAAEMEAKTWYPHTADSIRITLIAGIPCVVDGLHRVKAVIQSNVPLDTWIAYNVPEEAFKHVDGGVQRELRTLMSAADWPDPSILAVTGNMLWKNANYEGGPLNNVTLPSPGTVLDWLEDEEPRLHSYWLENKKRVKACTRNSHIPSAPMYYLWLTWSDADLDTANAVVDYLSDHTEYKPPNRVFLLAREKMLGLHNDFMQLKANKTPVNTNHVRAKMMEPLAFAWHRTQTNNARIQKTSGFAREFNAWLKENV